MKSFPSVSLVIATYNWPEALELCLMSVALQSTLPSEIIIADDGSGDETKDLVMQYALKLPVPVKHIWQPDEGFQLSRIRNKAMAAASGDYLIQIDGDIILHRLFVHDHLSAARPGYFIGGSRVLLGEADSRKRIESKSPQVSLFDIGLRNRLNGIHFPVAARIAEIFRKEKGIYNLRGCNMSFWKRDIIKINGYNEQISGWGREDTELVIRLYNNGLKRVLFKFQGIAYHLYHREHDRSRILENDSILKTTIEKKYVWCDPGIDQYL